jgi:hypothetical protein
VRNQGNQTTLSQIACTGIIPFVGFFSRVLCVSAFPKTA